MELLLNRQEMLDLGEDLQGISIICREGRCWVTQSGDSRDHILGVGGTFKTRTSGQLIITATEPCRLMLSEFGLQNKQRQTEKSFYGRLKACASANL